MTKASQKADLVCLDTIEMVDLGQSAFPQESIDDMGTYSVGVLDGMRLINRSIGSDLNAGELIEAHSTETDFNDPDRLKGIIAGILTVTLKTDLTEGALDV